jgi:hypothetical protein
MPLGPAQEYVVTYNGFQLPGYAQSENDPSEMGIVDHYAFGWDGSISQYAGLTNKNYTMEFLVWEPTYRACKDQYYTATTILRSRRDGFAPLYVDYTDRYLEATVKSITYSQQASESKRILRYSVEFDCRPWMLSTTEHTINGAGNINTDSVSRTISNGGWSPAYTVVSGTNITISGYTDTESFTGYVSISGAVSSFIIDTEASTTSFNGETGDGYMKWKDYGVWVGPGKTYWAVTGASSISVTYRDRWY